MNLLKILDGWVSKYTDWRMNMLFKPSADAADQIMLRKAVFDANGFSFDLETKTYISEGIAILAQEAARMLDMSKADNYVQFDMLPKLSRELRRVRVTVQWANGKSPAQKAADLSAVLERIANHEAGQHDGDFSMTSQDCWSCAEMIEWARAAVRTGEVQP